MASYSYSDDYIYGQTTNAANYGLQWSMDALFPSNNSLDINSVIYRYTTIKDPASYMLVSVQNEDTQGGYIFRSTDDWSGKPGGTINRIIPVSNIPLSRWGDGSIQVDGDGEVTDPTVAYTYRYEPKTQQVTVELPEVEIYDYGDDEAVKDAMEETDPDLYDRDGKRRNVTKSDEKLEKALRASDAANAVAEGVNQEAIMAAMSGAVKILTYYDRIIVGGTYSDAVTMPTVDIPDNKRGLRNNLAQQLKHQQMVDSQYER